MIEKTHTDRFGFDAPKDLPIEESITWGAANGFRYLDFNAVMPPNAIASFDDARALNVRNLLEETGMQMGLHPISAINNAEYVPIMSEAVDAYLQANVQLAQRIGCDWIIGHGGYHFGDTDRRRNAAVDQAAHEYIYPTPALYEKHGFQAIAFGLSPAPESASDLTY